MIMRAILGNLWRSTALLLAIWVAALLAQIHGVPLVAEGLKPALARCQDNLAAVIRAQAEAETLQAAVNEDEERRFAANAERSDAYHAQDLPRALAASGDYARLNRIAAGRLQPESDRGATGPAPAAAESGGADLHEGLPADTFVAVANSDLQACTAAVTWAVGAYNWAQTLPNPEPVKAALPD